MSKSRLMSCFLALLPWLAPTRAAAGPLATIAVSGSLRLNGGASTALTGTRDLEFRLYDALTGGSLLWSKLLTGVNINQGRFQVTLGPTGDTGGALSSVLGGGTPPTHIEIAVTNAGATEVLAPRLPMAAVAYALRAQTAEALAPGATVPLPASASITNALLAPNAVTSDKLAAGAVDLASGVVTGSLSAAQGGVPVGTVIQSLATAPPSGYLSMSGGVYSNGSYPLLSALLDSASHLSNISQASMSGLSGVSVSILANSGETLVTPMTSGGPGVLVSTNAGLSWAAGAGQDLYPNGLLVSGSNLLIYSGSSYNYSTNQGSSWNGSATIGGSGTYPNVGFNYNGAMYTGGVNVTYGSPNDYAAYIQSFSPPSTWTFLPVFNTPNYLYVSGVYSRGGAGDPILLATNQGILTSTSPSANPWPLIDGGHDYSFVADNGSLYCAMGNQYVATSGNGVSGWSVAANALGSVGWLSGGGGYFVVGRITGYPARTEVLASVDCQNWYRLLDVAGSLAKGVYANGATNGFVGRCLQRHPLFAQKQRRQLRVESFNHHQWLAQLHQGSIKNMELRSASILLICDDLELSTGVKEALEPVVKALVVAHDNDSARQRATRQPFDAYLLRLARPHLIDPRGAFKWSRQQKTHAHAPWIVLGQDIEKSGPENVHFLSDPADGVGLLQKLGVLFPRAAAGSIAAPAAGAAAGEPIGLADLKPMLSSAVAALRAVLGENLKRGDAYVRPTGEVSPLAEMACALSVHSERLSGSVAMHYPKASPLGSRILSVVTESARREYGTEGRVTLRPDPEGTAHAAKLQGNKNKITLCVPFETPDGRVIVECVATGLGDDEKPAA